jgi:hypothetical protein
MVAENPFDQNSVEKRHTTSKRLLMAIEADVKLATGEIQTYGEEHLKEIPPDKKVIIATTHISDLDVPIATLKLGKYFDIAITNQSIQHFFLREPSTNIGIRIAGRENFIPIDTKKIEGKKQGEFNPQNFAPMRDALEKGKAIIIAAHNPTRKWKLSKGGYGAAYLTAISENVVILPVVVNIESDEPLGMAETILKNIVKRPDASVYIQKPIELETINGIEDFERILGKRRRGEKLTKKERLRFSELKTALEKRSDQIMQALASGLPEKKRGKYQP